MRFLIDENVHVKIIDYLVSQGHDVMRVPSGIKNGQVVSLAQTEKRILVTNDKDFANRLLYDPNKYAGIIIFRIHPPTIEKLTLALQSLFVGVGAQFDWNGKLIIVEESGYHLIS